MTKSYKLSRVSKNKSQIMKKTKKRNRKHRKKQKGGEGEPEKVSIPIYGFTGYKSNDDNTTFKTLAKKYRTVLFIFNDNFIENYPGTGNNAQIRYFSNAIGIPTGAHKGEWNNVYKNESNGEQVRVNKVDDITTDTKVKRGETYKKSIGDILDETTKKIIDKAKHFDAIVFSAEKYNSNSDNNKFGIGLAFFKDVISEAVINKVNEVLENISNKGIEYVNRVDGLDTKFKDIKQDEIVIYCEYVKNGNESYSAKLNFNEKYGELRNNENAKNLNEYAGEIMEKINKYFLDNGKKDYNLENNETDSDDNVNIKGIIERYIIEDMLNFRIMKNINWNYLVKMINDNIDNKEENKEENIKEYIKTQVEDKEGNLIKFTELEKNFFTEKLEKLYSNFIYNIQYIIKGKRDSINYTNELKKNNNNTIVQDITQNNNSFFGLLNVGNTCFMNASLQLLFSSDTISNDIKQYNGNNKFFKELKEKILNSENFKNAKPKYNKAVMENIRDLMQKHIMPHYSIGSQQDANDLINLILYRLYDDPNYISPKYNYYSANIEKNIEKNIITKIIKETELEEKSDTNNAEPITDIDFPKNSNTMDSINMASINMASIINDFHKYENIDNVLYKRVFEKMGSEIILRLKRFSSYTSSGGVINRKKVTDFFNIEFEKIKYDNDENVLTNVVDNNVKIKTENIKYELVSVIVTSADTGQSGHYFTYRIVKEPKNKFTIYKFNDSTMIPLHYNDKKSLIEALNNNKEIITGGYVFLYKKVEEDSTPEAGNVNGNGNNENGNGNGNGNNVNGNGNKPENGTDSKNKILEIEKDIATQIRWNDFNKSSLVNEGRGGDGTYKLSKSVVSNLMKNYNIDFIIRGHQDNNGNTVMFSSEITKVDDKDNGHNIHTILNINDRKVSMLDNDGTLNNNFITPIARIELDEKKKIIYNVESSIKNKEIDINQILNDTKQEAHRYLGMTITTNTDKGRDLTRDSFIMLYTKDNKQYINVYEFKLDGYFNSKFYYNDGVKLNKYKVKDNDNDSDNFYKAVGNGNGNDIKIYSKDVIIKDETNQSGGWTHKLFKDFYESHNPKADYKATDKVHLFGEDEKTQFLDLIENVTNKQNDFYGYKKTFVEKEKDNITNDDDMNGFIYKCELKSTDKVVLFGDFHGSYHTFLRHIERLIKIGVISYKKNNDDANDNQYTYKMNDNYILVFLGDVVDRGEYALEIILFILMLIDSSPVGSVIYNRGNHETYEINKNYGFATEFLNKLLCDNCAIQTGYGSIPSSKEKKEEFNKGIVEFYNTFVKFTFSCPTAVVLQTPIENNQYKNIWCSHGCIPLNENESNINNSNNNNNTNYLKKLINSYPKIYTVVEKVQTFIKGGGNVNENNENENENETESESEPGPGSEAITEKKIIEFITSNINGLNEFKDDTLNNIDDEKADSIINKIIDILNTINKIPKPYKDNANNADKLNLTEIINDINKFETLLDNANLTNLKKNLGEFFVLINQDSTKTE